MSLAPGARLGPYEIIAVLGAGGMGEVYRARDSRLKRDVAIKVIRTDEAPDADRLRRFEQEARVTAALNHPNILVIYDVGLSDPSTLQESQGRPVPYIVSELLEGQSLRSRMDAGTPWSVRSALDLAAQVARGLGAAHGRGIVHRDLKPENVFVTKDGVVKIWTSASRSCGETTAMRRAGQPRPTFAPKGPSVRKQKGRPRGSTRARRVETARRR